MSEYRVLARKYRPQTFSDLVGQEALVRTLSNAIKSNRIAHAFLLTGIRGIGKTTTARIIARALNCIGEDGNGGATISPCGVCPNCVQIREDRHVDVIEMDAASRTGVGDIRELIETVYYPPAVARYKIYIIDEVHMLSTSAFNALLKTLEEPPANVIFIFATTEIRKIPLTILSRCQRFDLRRLDIDMLTKHLQNICEKENITAEEDGLRLLAQAASGSVRDGLSLLDRAISYSVDDDGNPTPIKTEMLRSMLGLADKTQLFKMLESLFSGDIVNSLKMLRTQYNDGLDISLMLQDMLSAIHSITRLKLDANDELGVDFSQAELEYARKLSQKLSIPVLSRAWQMILKGLEEVVKAPDALTAAEMVLIRFAHMGNLPTPDDLIRKLKNKEIHNSGSGGSSTASTTSSTSSSTAVNNSGVVTVRTPLPLVAANMNTDAPLSQRDTEQANKGTAIRIESFEDIVEYFRMQKESRIRHSLEHDFALVEFEVGKIVLSNVGNADIGLGRTIAQKLEKATSISWRVIIESDDRSKDNICTIAEQRERERLAEIEAVKSEPIVSAILNEFADGYVKRVHKAG